MVGASSSVLTEREIGGVIAPGCTWGLKVLQKRIYLLLYVIMFLSVEYGVDWVTGSGFRLTGIRSDPPHPGQPVSPVSGLVRADVVAG